jgi:hypothetical protein
MQFHEEEGGKILVIHISGKLVKADYPDFVAKFEHLVRQHGKLRVLFDMTGFHGWDLGAAREDIKFDIKHFADIERLAMIGEKRWQHRMGMFFKPFTKATTRYFDHADAAAAREWLSESAAVSVNKKAGASVTYETGPLTMDGSPEIVNPQFHYQNRRATHA